MTKTCNNFAQLDIRALPPSRTLIVFEVLLASTYPPARLSTLTSLLFKEYMGAERGERTDFMVAWIFI
jgi:hypothetical protein